MPFPAETRRSGLPGDCNETPFTLVIEGREPAIGNRGSCGRIGFGVDGLQSSVSIPTGDTESDPRHQFAAIDADPIPALAHFGTLAANPALTDIVAVPVIALAVIAVALVAVTFVAVADIAIE